MPPEVSRPAAEPHVGSGPAQDLLGSGPVGRRYRTDVHTTPPQWAYLMHECGLIMHELIARKTQNEHMAAELKRLVPLAVEETRKGAYLATTKYAVTGRKP